MLLEPTRMDPVDRAPDPRSSARGHASTVRRVVLTGSAILAATGLFWIGRSFSIDGKLRLGNPTDWSPIASDAPDPQPRQIRAEVTRVSGNPVVRAGDRCDFLVERRLRAHDEYYCNAQVVCGGRLLFGGPDRGYFPCKLYEDGRRDVVGGDPSTTAADQDAALLLNTHEGVMRIWDDAHGSLGEFSVEAEILSTQ